MRRISGRRSGFRRGRRGEVAAFDVVLFIPLLIVATLFLYAMLSVSPIVEQRNLGGTTYAADALQSFLSATAPNATLCVGSSGSPVPNDPCQALNPGWETGTVYDYSMAQLIALHLSLLESLTGAGPRASLEHLLDTPGWAGYVINNTASQVAMGSTVSLNPQTFAEYYLEYQNASTPVSPCAISSACVFMGFDATGTTGTIYSSSETVPGPAGGASPISVVLGVWA